MGYEILEMQLSDIDICAEVIRRSFLTVARDFGLTQENCPTNGAFIQPSRLLSDRQKGAFMYKLVEDNTIIGFMSLVPKDACAVELEKLAVLPEYRHGGYGKILLQYAREKSLSLGFRKITIGIIEENTRLKKWYSDFGFIHTGTKNFPHLPFTVGFMELILDE